MKAGRLAALVIALTAPWIATGASALQIITKEEAARPPPKGASGMKMRGVTRGPRAELLSAPQAQASPLHLRIRFQSFGGATISPDAIKVTYIRDPAVDLTPRLKEFIKPTGIDIPDAELPPGDHLVRVELRDSDGRTGAADFHLKVLP